jgi:hypothetical protein
MATRASVWVASAEDFHALLVLDGNREISLMLQVFLHTLP